MQPQPGPLYPHHFPPAHPGPYQFMYGPLPQGPQPQPRYSGPVTRRPGGMNFALVGLLFLRLNRGANLRPLTGKEIYHGSRHLMQSYPLHS